MKTTLTKSALFLSYMEEVPAHLKDLDGIKCQLAATAHLVLHLQARGAGWAFTPTTPGSDEDRRGIDGYLEHGKCRIPVDFSLESEFNPAGHKRDQVWLVHLKRTWFRFGSDGVVSLDKCFEMDLYRAFLPVLQAGMSLLRAA